MSKPYNVRLELAKEMVRQTFVRRNNFLSDDDLLDAADKFAPRTGELDAQVEHDAMIDDLYDWLDNSGEWVTTQ